MTPYEVMLSESQERMLLAVEERAVPAVTDLFEKWDLDATVMVMANSRYRIPVIAFDWEARVRLVRGADLRATSMSRLRSAITRSSVATASIYTAMFPSVLSMPRLAVSLRSRRSTVE